MSEKNAGKITELLHELTKLTMHGAIEVAWEDSEEELMKRFIRIINTPDDEYNPGAFYLMQAAGLTGTVLILKHGADEKELMNFLKDREVNFVKEIRNEE